MAKGKPKRGFFNMGAAKTWDQFFISAVTYGVVTGLAFGLGNVLFGSFFKPPLEHHLERLRKRTEHEVYEHYPHAINRLKAFEEEGQQQQQQQQHHNRGRGGGRDYEEEEGEGREW